jgi:ketosteroid isomerase-like protein
MTASRAAEAVCRAWSDLDQTALEGLFAESAVYEDPLVEGGKWEGREAIIKGVGEGMSGLATCRVGLHRTIEQGSVALSEGYFDASAPDGTQMKFAFALVTEVENGKVTRIAEYFDTRPLVP